MSILKKYEQKIKNADIYMCINDKKSNGDKIKGITKGQCYRLIKDHGCQQKGHYISIATNESRGHFYKKKNFKKLEKGC